MSAATFRITIICFTAIRLCWTSSCPRSPLASVRKYIILNAYLYCNGGVEEERDCIVGVAMKEGSYIYECGMYEVW
ncbi:hypothetical protein PtrV1_05039 [Pyrenophora tritici-repentis]|nr:hypothetical protein PtrV1_05039 [Pyrenophora tritici-repentis]KAI0570162.1 hypothetical protein Alg215_11222 [Pyrenophora tritici-repentis]